MNRPVLDWIYKFVDPVLAKFGLGKTEFVALVIVVLTVMSNSGMLPVDLRDWLVQNWQAWLAVGVAGIGLGLRDAQRKAGQPTLVTVQEGGGSTTPMPTWVYVAIGGALGWYLPVILERFAK